MSKNSKRKRKAAHKKRYNSSLKHHKKQGRTLSPPFMTIPNLKLTYWLKDDLPDMLWLTFLCSKYGDRGMVMARKVFDIVEQLLKELYGDLEKVPKDIWVLGRLSSFDGIPEELRPKLVQRLKLLGIYDTVFPKQLSVALSRYDSSPAKWLWGYPVPPKGHSQSELNEAETLLRKTVSDAWSGGNEVSTWAKMAVTSAMFSSGRVKITAAIADELADLLPKYPNGLTEDQRKSAESRMRAMYQGLRMNMPQGSVSEDWAKQFWRTNWRLYSCETNTEPGKMTKAEREAFDKYQTHISKRLEELRKRFFEAADVDPDIYDPTRYEVLTGIVSRMVRAVSIATNTPTMWSTEHGAGLIRGLVEARIVFAWLLQQADPTLFKKFQDYGRGHLKLLKLQLEEYMDKQTTPNPDLEAYIAELDQEVNEDISEEFQEIQAGGNFAGSTDTRKMAGAVGLGNDYRFIFAPASSSFHGEWTAVEQFALEKCRNPLHKGHRVPRRDAAVAMGPQLIELALDQLEDLIDRYVGL
jgi:hypothetical protein